MKTIKYILLALCLVIFIISLYSCEGGGDDLKSKKEELTEYLVGKAGGWSLKSITVQTNSATEESDWVNFKLSVSASTMLTSGHASGVENVWPQGVGP